MFFSKTVKMAFMPLILLTLALNLGCSDFLRGKKQTDQVMNVELAENKCLKALPDFLNAYFTDKASLQQIDQNFDCVQSALKTFLKYTRGEASDRYSDKELQHFFNRYLLSENQISDSFLAEAMKLKTLMVGGTRSSFTRPELDQISVSLNLIREQVKNLNGLSSLLLFQKDPKSVSFEELKAAEVKVRNAVTALILSFRLGGSDFEFVDIRSIVSELNIFTGNQGKLGEFLRWFPLMSSLKLVFLGQQPALGSKAEWTSAISWAVESYFMGQEFFYHTRLLTFDSGEDWKTAIRMTDWMVDLIERSPMMARKSYLATKDIDQMLKSILDLNIVKVNLSFDVLKNAYKKAIFHLVDGKKEGRGESFEIAEFNRSQFHFLKFEYEVWRQTQMLLAEVFSEQKYLALDKFLSAVKGFDRSKCVRVTNANRGPLLATLDEWTALMNQRYSAFMDSNRKIVLNAKNSEAQVSLESMSLQSGIKTLTRLTLHGYGDGVGRDLFSAAMTEDRIVDLEFNFREFGQAVGFLDPRQNGAPQRTFKEGNFFTFSGNGDKRFDGREIFELLHFMISGGSTITAEIEELIEKSQGHLSEKDVMGRAKSSEEKFRKVVENNFSEIFANMPLLVKAKEKMPRQEWAEIYSIVMEISRFDDAKFGVTEFAEIRSFASIVQYVESLFIQFDSDGSGDLSVSELIAAEPRFHILIKELSPLKTDWVVREAFLYLVAYGKIPSVSSELWDFAVKRVSGKPLEKVTRLQLFRVLRVLKNNAL